jgi:molybdopterin-guanine dinucleotide biosynthesis protein A
MPYMNEKLIGLLLEESENHDVVVPRGGGELQVLHAVYSVECIGAASGALNEKRFQVKSFFGDVRTKVVEIDESKWLVDGKSPFTNVNTQDEYQDFLRTFENRD